MLGGGIEKQISRTETSLEKGHTTLQPEQQSAILCLFHFNYLFLFWFFFLFSFFIFFFLFILASGANLIIAFYQVSSDKWFWSSK